MNVLNYIKKSLNYVTTQILGKKEATPEDLSKTLTDTLNTFDKINEECAEPRMRNFQFHKGRMSSKQLGFNRVLDGLAKRQLLHDFQLEKASETYEPIRNIGCGAFGIVCEAVETSSGERVAIKKIGHASATPTLARRTLREIRVLRFIDHPNIVNLRDIFRTQGPLGTDVYLVMDLMEGNLHHIIYGNQEPLEEDIILHFLYQLLRGLQYLHKAQIAHRDLKPSNLLVNGDATLRIADFGMAKLAEKAKFDESEEHCFYMTQHVATLPYRAPELLFVMPEHSTAVDMWAVGCIFAEMFLKRELFPGRSVQAQLKILTAVFGKPSQKILNEIRCERTRKLLESYSCGENPTFDQLLYNSDRTERISCDGINFTKELLALDADDRMTIEQTMQHPYIRNHCRNYPPESSCPFRVKKDMADVENLNHQKLIEALCRDVKSAENPYKELHSGGSTGHKDSSDSSESSLSGSPSQRELSVPPESEMDISA